MQKYEVEGRVFVTVAEETKDGCVGCAFEEEGGDTAKELEFKIEGCGLYDHICGANAVIFKEETKDLTDYEQDGRIFYAVHSGTTRCSDCAFYHDTATGHKETAFRAKACSANISRCLRESIEFKERKKDLTGKSCYIKVDQMDVFLHKDGKNFTLYGDERKYLTEDEAFAKVEEIESLGNISINVFREVKKHEIVYKPAVSTARR